MFSNRQLLVGLLRRGNTGTEILNILELIVNDYTDTNTQFQDELITPAIS